MSMALERHTYPFTAIVGQESMKLALILNAIVPATGGVLIRGEKGTGKSTAVRALARLLPEHLVVQGCHFGCDPDDRDNLCADCRLRLAERDADFKRGDHEFLSEFSAADANLSRALAEAIAAVPKVSVTKAQTRLITSICVEADVLGHRADVVIDRAVRALSAYRRHRTPTREDIYDAATLALA